MRLTVSRNLDEGLLPKRGYAPTLGWMPVCRRPDCDQPANTSLGFCAKDHAAYLRYRETVAALVAAAEIAHAGPLALLPSYQRRVIAEYVVALATEGRVAPALANVPAVIELIAAALIASAHGGLEDRSARRAPGQRRGGREDGGRSGGERER